ncbi:MAG TPA: hypothetical protein VKK79_14505 [Candidatus Lokiarchaeia archaeon]|nr:hypothetical protein [Candidatus Lokiarchaeia archaeon]
MTLSSKSIDFLRQKEEINIWNYISALQQMQNTLFLLEKETDDPEILKELATRAIEVSQEIKSILASFSEEDEEEE